MILITEIENYENIPQYGVDGIIFSYINFATLSNKNFTLDEIKEIIKIARNKKKLTILKIDKILEEHEIEELYCFLDEVQYLNIDYYMFSDMAVLNYFKKKKQTDKLIYSAKTINCSYNDSSFYHDLGIKVILSNELTIEDLQDITRLNNIVIDGYGYSNIFYSKRQLISLFKEHTKTEAEVHDKLLSIKEEKRNNRYPILENDSGTFIFTSHKYAVYKELEALKNCFMFKIESLFIQEENLFKIIAIYRNAIDYGISEEDYEKLIFIDKNISDSFLYKKPSILAGDNE